MAASQAGGSLRKPYRGMARLARQDVARPHHGADCAHGAAEQLQDIERQLLTSIGIFRAEARAATSQTQTQPETPPGPAPQPAATSGTEGAQENWLIGTRTSATPHADPTRRHKPEGIMRVGEAIRFRWQDVDFTRGQLHVGNRGDTKNRRPRVVDFNSALRAHLQAMHRRRDRRWPGAPARW